MKAITETLVKQDLMEANPWGRVDFSAKSTNRIREATPREIKLIVEGGNPVLITLAYTGMRIAELYSRDKEHLSKDLWLDIDNTSSWTLKHPSSKRRLPIPEWIGLELPTWRKSKLGDDLKKICPDLSCHGLRHSFKTAIREAQIPFDIGEFILGHSAPGGDIASRYGSFSDDAVKSSIEKVLLVIDGWIERMQTSVQGWHC